MEFILVITGSPAYSLKITFMLISHGQMPSPLQSLHTSLRLSLLSTRLCLPRGWNRSKPYMDWETKMEVTKVKDATRIYKIGEVETKALRGVSLSIENGEFTALVGPSGSGKTTLLQLIGLLDQPTTGSVSINGKDATGLNRNQRADLRKDSIGFVFPFFALIPTLNAYENVEMPLLLNGTKPADRKKRVNEMLEAVCLSDRAHHRPDQLSGGQQQRVAVARALATN